jgi:CheY-like chemotaxis protein
MSAVILYVDSDVGSRRTHKLLLESAGYQVLTAETVAEAYRIFSSAPTPDLVIAEYHVVEDANGIKLAAQLKSVRPELPVLLLSATEEPAGLEHVEAFVHKLEGPTALLDKVQQLLKLRL